MTDEHTPTMGERIKTMLAERRISQAELARRIGTKQQTVGFLIQRGSNHSRYASPIARELAVNLEWLTTGLGERDAPSAANVRAQNPIAVFTDAEIEATLANKPIPAHPGRIMLRTQAATGPRAFAFEVSDDAMSPNLSSGDMVIADPDVRPLPGDTVIALLSGQALIRRFRPTAHGKDSAFELRAISADFPPIQSTPEAPVTLAGVIVEQRIYRRR